MVPGRRNGQDFIHAEEAAGSAEKAADEGLRGIPE